MSTSEGAAAPEALPSSPPPGPTPSISETPVPNTSSADGVDGDVRINANISSFSEHQPEDANAAHTIESASITNAAVTNEPSEAVLHPTGLQNGSSLVRDDSGDVVQEIEGTKTVADHQAARIAAQEQKSSVKKMWQDWADSSNDVDGVPAVQGSFESLGQGPHLQPSAGATHVSETTENDTSRSELVEEKMDVDKNGEDLIPQENVEKVNVEKVKAEAYEQSSTEELAIPPPKTPRKLLKEDLKEFSVVGGALLKNNELQRHLDDLARESNWVFTPLTLLLRRLVEHKSNRGVFNSPVDPIALEIPTYFDIVKEPMDLGTIRNKLQNHEYPDLKSFGKDVKLVFSNAMLFNPPRYAVHQAAKKLDKAFHADFDKLLAEQQAQEDSEENHFCQVCEGDLCGLCGRGCLHFQEAVLRCSAPCKARITRNSIYYRLGGDRGQHWCSRCYTGLPEQFLGVLGQSIQRGDLEKRVHNQIFRERWVKCGHCHRRVHQICSLFHPSIVRNTKVFKCAICVAGERGLLDHVRHLEITDRKIEAKKARAANDKKRPADDMDAEGKAEGTSHNAKRSRTGSESAMNGNQEQQGNDQSGGPTELSSITNESSSNGIEQQPAVKEEHNGTKVETAPSENAQEEEGKAKSDVETVEGVLRDANPWADSLPHTAMSAYLERTVREAACKVSSQEIADTISLRVSSSRSFVTEYEARALRWIEAQRKSCSPAYDQEDFPRQFPCRSKTVLLFQRIDGVDVLCFVLYVQEYGADCPAPNRRCIYVSYLDSVAYIEPPSVRTVCYQQVMVSYLRWCKARGFETCYIWACPPQRGDAYILYCHPKWQRSPGIERLRKWYNQIVQACKDEGVVLDETNYYDKHLSQFKPLLNTRSSRGRGGGRNKNLSSDILDSDAALSPTAALAEAFRISKIKTPVESVPYFYGDYLPNEIESLLNILRNPRSGPDVRLTSSCDEQIAVWWREVWGDHTDATLLHDPRAPPSPQSAPTASASATTAPPITPTKNGGPEASNGSTVPAKGSTVSSAGVLTPQPSMASEGKSGTLEAIRSPTWKVKPTADLSHADLSKGFASPQQRNDWLMRRLAAAIKPMSDNFLVLALNDPGALDIEAPQVTNLGGVVITNDTVDPDPELPPSIFDTRMEFLDICKHNNIQFDELRRAKHSSLVLMHYHKKAMQQGLQAVTPATHILWSSLTAH